VHPISLISFGYLHLPTDPDGQPVPPAADRIEDVRDRLRDPAAARDILDLDGFHPRVQAVVLNTPAPASCSPTSPTTLTCPPVPAASRSVVQEAGTVHAASVATAGVDVVVGLGDVVQRVTGTDDDGEGADGGGGGEVAGGLALGLDGEVVAAEQPQGDVVEQQRTEGDLGAVRAGGVGGDDGVVGGDGVVEIGVVGQRDLDDPVDAPRRVRANGRGGVAGVQGDGVGDDGRVRGSRASQAVPDGRTSRSQTARTLPEGS
jgi:hypothetical protein